MERFLNAALKITHTVTSLIAQFLFLLAAVNPYDALTETSQIKMMVFSIGLIVIFKGVTINVTVKDTTNKPKE